MKEENVIIVIPAKSTSKRLERKNFLKIGGIFNSMTLIDIAVSRSKNLRKDFDCDIVVSFDNFQDLEKYRNENKDVHIFSIVRGDRVNNDSARAFEVCIDAIFRMHDVDDVEYTTLIMTLPTSPFCSVKNIKEAYQMFLDNSRSPVMSVTKIDFNPNTISWIQNCVIFPYIDKSGYFWKSDFVRSDGDKNFCLSNGAIWIVDVQQLLNEKEQYIDGTIAYETNKINGFDINTKEDFEIAVALSKYRKERLIEKISRRMFSE